MPRRFHRLDCIQKDAGLVHGLQEGLHLCCSIIAGLCARLESVIVVLQFEISPQHSFIQDFQVSDLDQFYRKELPIIVGI